MSSLSFRESTMASSVALLVISIFALHIISGAAHGSHPLARIAIEKTVFALNNSANITVTPSLLGAKHKNVAWVTVTFTNRKPSKNDWIGVFSPSKFNHSICPAENSKVEAPYLCTAPIKFQYANFSNSNYVTTGKGSLKIQLINQRADSAFALFGGGISKPILLAISNTVTFLHPKAPSYPRIALGKSWDEMSVTWTSGYSLHESTPVVQWGVQGEETRHMSPAGTTTFHRSDMCGAPANSVGWRDPGFIHSYSYRVGHRVKNRTYVWGELNSFRSSPYPGQVSLQRVIIVGDIGKAERDHSTEYNDFQPGSLNTTDRLIEDLENIDIVFHIGDIVYANGYLSQWDQFTSQIEPIASRVPYMIASGNHERDWPNTGSFYKNLDSGGECGVPSETMFYVPANNRAKFWYSTDYGLFHFCVASSELDWREGTEQYKFLEDCLASADRRRQPWLIFIAHRVLGYSSASFYANEGSFGEPMGRTSLQKLWQTYKVDLAVYGHAHCYERTCPVLDNVCVSDETQNFSGRFNATIHLVVGGGGAALVDLAPLQPNWSLVRDRDFGFVKLTAFNQSSLLVEYRRSSDSSLYDHFWISRRYADVLGCDSLGNCPPVTQAS